MSANSPSASPSFPVDWCRVQFPALTRQNGGHPAVFFDGPAGSQTPECVSHYLRHTNANHGGVFDTSRESDALLEQVHSAVADFFGVTDPSCVIFGANMTTLNFQLSRVLARDWGPGDEIVVTRLDHDANVSPWVLAARDAGATVHHLAVRTGDCTLDLENLRQLLTKRTRLVAVGAASNAVGTINPISEICRLAHAVGAEVAVDAVHAAPHRLPEIEAWDCDWCLASAYKFFGPHVGVLWGRRARLEQLPAYKVRPATNSLPGKWMTGTQNHECLAGVGAAIGYLERLGRKIQPAVTSRRDALVAAYRAIREYEELLSRQFLEGIAKLPAIQLYGISDPARLSERVATFGLRHRRIAPLELAERLAREGIFVWNGNFYALPLTEALGLEPEGLVRIGFLHYNTPAEVDRLLQALRCE
jgi:cysteine desulfurase family protein (TIGR01976 family)